MIIKSTKFPNGIHVMIADEGLFSKDNFVMLTETPKVVMAITQGFADYLKKEPDFEKAFVEYGEFLKK